MAKKKTKNGAIGFEDKLWKAADKLRNNMDAAEYKHVVLGLIFLKYISDAFEEKYQALQLEEYADPEDEDEYLSENVFWVPKEARWNNLQDNSKKPDIGKMVDDAMDIIEKHNPSLKGVLPKIYARGELDKIILGGVIDLISDVTLGDKDSQSKDILGKVYEYFLGKFAQQEGKGGGEFFTPTSIVRLLVAMIEPYKGRVYDPCCGSGGMFVQSKRFVDTHGGRKGDISVYGQESNPTTWKLAKMNMAIRGIEANLGTKHADSFHNDLHKSLKANYILANPPFNDKDWGFDRLKEDIRWKYGNPPRNNANFAWVQHFVHHLAPNGVAGFVLANGSLSSQTSGEGDIRKTLVEGDLIDCVISLPSQLFLTTQIPACLWFLSRNKKHPKRDRSGEVLFIDTRQFGFMIDRTTKEFTKEDIEIISSIYHNWKLGTEYQDTKGLCKASTIEEITINNYVLTPGRYVGIEDNDDGDDYIFEERYVKLREKLVGLQEESAKVDKMINQSLEVLENEFMD